MYFGKRFGQHRNTVADPEITVVAGEERGDGFGATSLSRLYHEVVFALNYYQNMKILWHIKGRRAFRR